MESSWSQAAVEGKGPLETLVYVTRLLGSNPDLVLWGGGNTSIKVMERDVWGRGVRVLRVKATGVDMATIDEKGFAGVRLDDVLPLREKEAMSDHEVIAYLDHALLEPRGSRPSVETFLHAFVPEAVVLHSHANAILSLADTVEAEALIHEVYQGKVPAIPYVRSGFALAKAVIAAYEAHPGAPGLILLRHGLVTWGATAKEAYERHIQLVTRAERAIEERKGARVVLTPRSFPSLKGPSGQDGGGRRRARRKAAFRLLPVLRGLVSRDEHRVIHFEDSDAVMNFVDSKEAATLSQVGPVTPDHMFYTKRVACYVPVDDPADVQGVEEALKAAVAAFIDEYVAYLQAHGGDDPPAIDPVPRVILVPGIGMFTVGKDAREAGIARDLYTAGIKVMTGASAVGTFASLTASQAFAVETWPRELYRLSAKPNLEKLAGKIALVAGGARGIGRAVVEKLLGEGAHLIVIDDDLAQVQATCRDLEQGYPGRVRGVAMDLTCPQEVEDGLSEAVLAFGGIDIVVDCSKSAPAHSVMTAVDMMKAQGMGGTIVWIGNGKTGEKPARALAMELGPEKIRVNMIIPGSMEEISSKETVHTGWVTPRDVAEVVYFLASDASAKMTGCVIPVDGGAAVMRGG